MTGGCPFAIFQAHAEIRESPDARYEQECAAVPCGRKRKRKKISTHKRKKKLRKNRHKKKGK